MKNIIFFLLVCVSNHIYSQRVLEMVSNNLPEEGDSGRVYVWFNTSYFFPGPDGENSIVSRTKTVLPQRRILEGQRIFSGEMEMLTYPFYDFSNRFQPLVFMRAQVFLNNYMNSMIGIGVTEKNTNLTLGFFTGGYFRRVDHPDRANVHRKGTHFEQYSFWGGFVDNKTKYFSLMMSLAVEKNEVFKYGRFSLPIGSFSTLLSRTRFTKSLKVFVSVQTFSGFSTGFSFEPIPQMVLDFSVINPSKNDVINQAKLDQSLSQGVLFSVGYYVQ